MPHAFLQFHPSKKKKFLKMASPKGPKFREKDSYVMADLDIKFGPNRSRKKFPFEKCHRPCRHEKRKKKLAAPNELKFIGKYSQVMAHLDIKFEPNRSR
jgi:hypothetical protein